MSCGVPAAGISKASIEVSLDGKTVPSCADTMPRSAMHMVSTSSTGLEKAMMGWERAKVFGLGIMVANIQDPSVGGLVSW